MSALNECQAAPTITPIGGFLLIECAECGDSWTTARNEVKR